MLIGYENLIKTFQQLVKNNRLAHSYIFFGEAETGKFSFARALAAYLEGGQFEPAEFLQETIIIRPNEKDIIGIDAVRDLKYFLAQKPVQSERRVAIIDEGEKLTHQAENAILKIAEEPPASSLIILIVTNPEILLDTLQSRFQKIYFPRLSPDLIKSFLIKQYRLKSREAEELARASFGRPGRAIKLLQNEAAQEARQMALALLRDRKNKQRIISALIEDKEKFNYLLADLISELAKDPLQNWTILKLILDRLGKMAQFNTNPRIQLEAALWNI
jgi:DNA polymerase-3 subunit delta'